MEKRIRYIAVDDSLLDLLTLEEYAKKFLFLEKSGSFCTSNEALAAVKELKPHLIFLDIEMPGMNGVDILKQIRTEIPLAIFITSHPEFALDGFELSAFDYILKPLTEERFSATAGRLKDYWTMKQKAAAYEVLFESDYLVFKEGYDKVKLPVHEVVYLEAMQDYTKVVTSTRNYLTLTTLTAFLEKLPTGKFMRIHRSYAMALNKINEIRSSEIVCNNYVLPIGKTYRSAVADLKI